VKGRPGNRAALSRYRAPGRDTGDDEAPAGAQMAVELGRFAAVESTGGPREIVLPKRLKSLGGLTETL
jgi:hypothetical protein